MFGHPNFCCTSSWDWSHSSIRRRSAAARDYAISARYSPVAIGSQVTGRLSLGNSIRKPWFRVSRSWYLRLPYQFGQGNRKHQVTPSKELCTCSILFKQATSLCFFSCTWESPFFCINAFCSAWSFCIRAMTCGRSDSGCFGNSECTLPAGLIKRLQRIHGRGVVSVEICGHPIHYASLCITLLPLPKHPKQYST